MPDFSMDIRTQGYNPTNAYWLGRASALAYNAEDEIGQEVDAWGLSDFRYFSAADTQAFLAANDEVILVGFRGTEPTQLEDWMSDLKINLVGGPSGRVHEGFQLALGAVWPELYSAILEQRSQDRRQSLWFTGHSLGAALATLAVAKLRLERDHPVTGLYTFGHPRTGDAEFARIFDSDMGHRTYRVVHNNDVVARVPFRSMKYSHVGQFVYFDGDHNRQGHLEWWELLLDRIEGRWDDLFDLGTDGIKDHAMTQYVDCLENDLPG